MKKRICQSATSTNFLILCVFGMVLLSCSKNNNNEENPGLTNPDGDYVICNIDDKSFSSEYVAASYGLDIFAITGITLNGEKFVNVTIFNPVEGKTYTLNKIVDEYVETNVTTATELDENYTARRNIGSGTITLTYFDGESAAGTFSVEAVHEDDPDKKISITNGKFSATSIIEL
ncbi:hypothetical protein [Tamlana crocina]|uniref:Uncharacterized protein n=1 Tax=Tamlana crocina TaxID=393006 RepID=A0ABX1DHL9_9FLAO|nr:hypothetical protein [Tamlana crocina]NJX15811.1 hypothetical protein [Tamlana crocina]